MRKCFIPSRSLLAARRLGARSALVGLLTKNQRNNKTVKSKRFCENQDENHTNEQLLLLSHCSHARVSHDADGHPRGQAR
jgi:hypothetical protein